MAMVKIDSPVDSHEPHDWLPLLTMLGDCYHSVSKYQRATYCAARVCIFPGGRFLLFSPYFTRDQLLALRAVTASVDSVVDNHRVLG